MPITTLDEPQRKRIDYLKRKAANPNLFLEKAREAQRRYRGKHPLYTRNCHAQRRYGMSIDELTTYVKSMAIEQNNKCAVCGVGGEAIGLTAKKEVIRLILDHNHKNNKPRGLLCDSCNHALGWVKEDEDILKSLLFYLRKWNGGQ